MVKLCKIMASRHFDKFAKYAIDKFNACKGTLKECAFATRTYKHYHSGQVRLAMTCYGPSISNRLGHTPYVLYGVKYIGLVSLDDTARPSQMLTSRLFSEWLPSKIWV